VASVTSDVKGEERGTAAGAGSPEPGEPEELSDPVAVSTELPPTPSLVPLTEPQGGVPPVITSPADLRKLAETLAGGSGPAAVDAERASGYRYGQRAYLVQVRRAGVGTGIVDPIALPNLRILSEALDGVEWVVHAASQDLPCLAEVGLVPTSLFDTELAGRLLGRSRVGLGALVAEELGLYLAKEHSAVDWSTRPLPQEWLRYAALDVEVLVELRDRLAADLAEAGKAEWAAQEFEAVRLAPAPEPRLEPWRRLSGLHQVRDPRRLAVARALWEERDAQARSRDISPGRILPDAGIVEAARSMPRSVEQLLTIPQFAGRATRRRAAVWQAAVGRALSLPESALPGRRAPARDALPPPRAWQDRDPDAAGRLERIKACVRAVAEAHDLPQENLLAPDTQRRLAWAPPPADLDAVADFLRACGARPWQVELCAAPLAAALAG
jgi:ribonuclease D